jgi:hypothetical protein
MSTETKENVAVQIKPNSLMGWEIRDRQDDENRL